MPMREECKHFQSRTYASGEVARFCVLDLAPEAPWRCPDNCPRYQRRLADAGWQHGNLVDTPVENEPEMPSGDIASLLDAAESVVESAAPSALAEVRERERKQEGRKGLWRRKKP
ncbi:MAG: hypothetical protein ABSD78_10775 [Acidimicrobiales bacterium]|jgi:hypothetical protein